MRKVRSDVEQPITQEVYKRLQQNPAGQEQHPALPDFEQVSADEDEATACSEEMRQLFHQLGYLNRSAQVSLAPETASRFRFGKALKTVIAKLCLFLLDPLVRQQNRINLQTESCMRSMLHQMNRLTEENARLRDELSGIKESMNENLSDTAHTDKG